MVLTNSPDDGPRGWAETLSPVSRDTQTKPLPKTGINDMSTNTTKPNIETVVTTDGRSVEVRLTNYKQWVTVDIDGVYYESSPVGDTTAMWLHNLSDTDAALDIAINAALVTLGDRLHDYGTTGGWVDAVDDGSPVSSERLEDRADAFMRHMAAKNADPANYYDHLGPFMAANRELFMPQVTIGDRYVDYAAAVNLMDPDIREQLHTRMVPCSDQDFADAYCTAHEAKFGEGFEVA